MRVLAALCVATLIIAGPAHALLGPESQDGSAGDGTRIAPAATAPATLSAASAADAPSDGTSAALADLPQTPQEYLQRIEADLGVAHDEPGAPEALRNLAVLVQQPNGTNGTAVAEPNGTVTHQHGHLGEQGLSPVWATPFHGTARHMLHADVDGDGTQDTIIGTDISVTALSGKDGGLLWAQHIGSRVSALLETDIGGEPHVIVSTYWDAQNARISALRLADGHERWRYEAPSSVMSAALADETGDVVAVTRGGTHLRVAATDGSLVWESRPALSVPLAGFDLGVYHAAAVDVNGDGVTDTVGANLLWVFGAPFTPTDRDSTEIYAVDGATGELLWMHDVGSAPGSFTFHFLLDMHPLDADGDGAYDIALTGYSWGYYYAIGVPGSAQVYTSHLRIIDGTSEVVGVPLTVRDLPQPVALVDIYTQLSGHDADGDGSDELLAMHANIANGLLVGSDTVIERLEPLASGPGAFVSDIQVPVSSGAVFDTPFAGPDGTLVPVLWGEGLAGHAALLDTSGSLAAQISFPADDVAEISHDGKRFVVATPAHAMFRDTLEGKDAFSFPMRGAPHTMDLGDRDGDGIEDLWIVSNDGNLYVLDGLTGQVLETVDRDDIAAGIHLQDADGDGVADPYLMVLKEGELFAGVFYVYEAATHLLNHTDLKPRWQADGFPYRDTWLDVDHDGILDFVSSVSNRYDFDAGGYRLTVTVVDGRTGVSDDFAQLNTDGSYWPDAVVPYATGSGDGLLIVDGWEGAIMLDAKGKLVKKDSFDDIWFDVCAAAVDFDGDGIDSVVVIKQRWDDKESHVYAADGKKQPVNVGMGSLEAADCTLVAVDDRSGGEDLLVMASGWNDSGDRSKFIGRYGEEGYVWKQQGAQGTPGWGYHEYIGEDVLAPEGGRVFYAYQDHVYARSWENGEMVGQFTANGPFIEAGHLLDLDGKRPAELVVITSDGLAWALAEDRDAVAASVAKEARKQGKDLGDDVAGVADLDDAIDGKKSPGVAVPLIALAALAIAMTRRRQA